MLNFNENKINEGHKNDYKFANIFKGDLKQTGNYKH